MVLAALPEVFTENGWYTVLEGDLLLPGTLWLLKVEGALETPRGKEGGRGEARSKAPALSILVNLARAYSTGFAFSLLYFESGRLEAASEAVEYLLKSMLEKPCVLGLVKASSLSCL